MWSQCFDRLRHCLIGLEMPGLLVLLPCDMSFWLQRRTLTFTASDCGSLPLAIRAMVRKLS